MNAPSPFLQNLEPPTGGWEYLVERRNNESWSIAAAALTGAVAVLALAIFWPHRPPIELKSNGARLIGQHSQGITLRMLDGRHTTALPSDDPHVELYWIDGEKSQKAK